MDQPKKDKSKHNRPDTPLANTPEPLPLYFSTQAAIQAGRSSSLREIAEKRDAERTAKKAMDEAKERLNR